MFILVEADFPLALNEIHSTVLHVGRHLLSIKGNRYNIPVSMIQWHQANSKREEE
jgi:hypothetical protein